MNEREGEAAMTMKDIKLNLYKANNDPKVLKSEKL